MDSPFLNTVNSSGNRQTMIQGPAIQSFPQPTKWQPRDAALIHRLMLQRAKNNLGLFDALKHVHVVNASQGIPKNYQLDLQEARQLQQFFISTWTLDHDMMIFAEQDFASMMLAAAITAPDEPLYNHDLIAPEGVIYFQHPLNIRPLVELSPSAQTQGNEILLNVPIRAIQWNQDPEEQNQRFIRILADGKVTQAFGDQHYPAPAGSLRYPAQYYDHLATIVSETVPCFTHHTAENAPTPNSVKYAIALLRAVKAIAESPMTQRRDAMNDAHTKQRKRKASRRRNLDHELTSLKIVSLRKPEYGQYELDAVTGQTPKTPQRAHWVRGHWRNQWYPSTQAHHTIWIDGFIKGDPSVGDDTAVPTIYVAQGDDPVPASTGDITHDHL